MTIRRPDRDAIAMACARGKKGFRRAAASRIQRGVIELQPRFLQRNAFWSPRRGPGQQARHGKGQGIGLVHPGPPSQRRLNTGMIQRKFYPLLVN